VRCSILLFQDRLRHVLEIAIEEGNAILVDKPFGSLVVRDTVDRIMLAAFELAAVGAEYLASPTFLT
jgi:hypothetical protein